MCSCVQLVKVSLWQCRIQYHQLNLLDWIAVIGAVEELAQSSRTISLVDEIFEINFFANVNIIKAILPVMRERKNGHIIVITGISKPILDAVMNTNSLFIAGHLGTPGLGMYCSSQWAIEGYCDVYLLTLSSGNMI
jgi:NAD(P)-dependent dehydrogenase (short-subunit alcohol dehydrogenase family)